MPNKKMTKTVKKKPGKVRNFINSIIFNKETPKQGRKRAAKEKAENKGAQEERDYKNSIVFKKGGKLMGYKHGGKLWSNRANQMD